MVKMKIILILLILMSSCTHTPSHRSLVIIHKEIYYLGIDSLGNHYSFVDSLNYSIGDSIK